VPASELAEAIACAWFVYGAGQVSPSEAAVMLQALAAQARIVEIDDLEKRVTTLEDKGGR